MKLFIDVGTEKSGLIVTTNDLEIIECHDAKLNTDIIDTIIKFNVELVVVEGISSQGKNIGKTTMDTIEYIGYIHAVCDFNKVTYQKIDRFNVKQSLFNNQIIGDEEFLTQMKEYVQKRKVTQSKNNLNQLLKKEKNESKRNDLIKQYEENSKRKMDKMYFSLLDDRLITQVVRSYFNIEKPKVGQKNKYKISKHGYQALALLIAHKNNLKNI